MAYFVDHLRAEIEALERDLERDPRSVKLRELRRVEALYAPAAGAASADSPSLKEVAARKQRRPPPREMTSTTKAVVEAATEYLCGRTDVVPLRTLYDHLAHRGIRIGGKNPVNSLSAILSRYGFEASGRAGWKLPQSPNVDVDEAPREETAPPPKDNGLFCAPRANGAAFEIHGAATP